MRIISGTYRGLRLATLKGGKLRPTSDQLRETLFDVLGPQVEGLTFLDAYAGSGAVGLEALSRGAREVVFIEHHRPAIELIRQNLAALRIESGFRG
jgi:16S rRNA (guanine966-N2)-methyltransferase